MEELEIKKYFKLIYGYNEIFDKLEKETINEFYNTLKTKKIDLYNEIDYMLFKIVFIKLFSLECALYGIDKNIMLNFKDEEESDLCTGEFIFDKKNNKENLNINIYCISSLVDDLNDDSVIKRYNAFSYYLKSFYHEMTHLRQYERFNSGIHSIDNLRFAKELIFDDKEITSENDLKKAYSLNHDEFSIEANSDMESYKRMARILDNRFVSNIMNASVREIDFYFSNIDFMYKEGKYKSYDRDEFVDMKTDDLVKNNLFLINKYPILKVEYNEDGSKKRISDLLNNMYSELDNILSLELKDQYKLDLIDNIYSLYYELIYKRLLINDQDEINEVVSSIGIDSFTNICNSLKEYFRNKKKQEINLSKKKYSIKSNLDSELNYIKFNGFNKRISVYKNNTIFRIPYDDLYDEVDTRYEKEIGKVIKKYIIYRIPDCGYFLLKNGEKILPFDLIDNYLIKEIKPNMKLNDIIILLKKYVKSTSELEHFNELEKSNSRYQKRINVIDNVIYDLKEGVKL